MMKLEKKVITSDVDKLQVTYEVDIATDSSTFQHNDYFLCE